ncbi:50S ribosomal protein L18 [Phycisphaera mikurensis]|uniref:Large ribosomal subunit protein uL18 n=1 Tax=Phycisphaera mikurensis (strain NBRC 102666 / KCTC 22515 / FYK2301M01) TaxID=1142394 RepID=I0IIH3_PHYMF|nr:50S ribosomal protein L18 [Phycisphaera mikurensis]MBB6442783.1 large subunit ribosomal protein L18 [Phycisphaera mikurensis]BAM05061.1 50S ribosomal protein L18 [Phycisphaera mikurensis NBRC 102666]
MQASRLKNTRRTRRKAGIRKRLYGTADQPRLTVFRSSKHVYAQVIDDSTGKTLASASSVAAKLDNGATVEAAKQIGNKVAAAAKEAGIEAVAFDRNGFRFHGRVKALADAAREGGLSF